MSELLQKPYLELAATPGVGDACRTKRDQSPSGVNGLTYCFWWYGPSKKMYMLLYRDLHVYVCGRIDTSDRAHHGQGTWCYHGLTWPRHKIEAILKTEDDVLSVEQQEQRTEEKPRLGHATNAMLLDELWARIEVHWDLDYYTTRPEEASDE